MNRLLPILLLLSAPTFACDWTAKRTVDPMTDVVTCTVTSPSAKLSVYRHGDDRPNVSVASVYSRPGLSIRVDENPAVYMGDNAAIRQRALDQLLPQLMTGQRVRTSFRDYPSHQAGDAPVLTCLRCLSPAAANADPT